MKLVIQRLVGEEQEPMEPLSWGRLSFVSDDGEMIALYTAEADIMLILPSLNDLLCGLTDFLGPPRTKKYVFSGLGASSEVAFEKRKGDRIELKINSASILVADARRIYQSVKDLANDVVQSNPHLFIPDTRTDGTPDTDETITDYLRCLERYSRLY